MVCGLRTFVIKLQQRKRSFSFLLFSILIIGIHPTQYIWSAEINGHKISMEVFIIYIFTNSWKVIMYSESLQLD